MYLVKTPQLIQSLFPNFTWKIPSTEKVLYLTFDDGPIPSVTPWVMEQLEQYNAKATFFCVGDNVKKHPEIFQQLISKGHAIGSHTQNHLNGWITDNIPYFHNVRHAANLTNSVLFRPPYGRLRPKQAQFLQRHYRIVMWDVLSGDFDPRISPEQCLTNVISNATEGSIIVFHDSLKAEDKLNYVLPKVLEHFTKEGYVFEKLSEQNLAQQPLRKIA
jgi:peptidoglycan/xylan/chitin deacetylase (PgdA/CDA1 family)